jgi:nucleoid-associated protein YgaU
MTIRFLLITAIAVAVLAGCAKPPLAELETARYQVRYAAEVGAADWSPGEYQLARDALAAAEQQMELQQYRAAARTIGLAQRYAEVARKESQQAVARLAESERQRAEKARRQEEQLQRELAEEMEMAQRQRELEQRRRQDAQQEAARAASAASAAKLPPSPPPPQPPPPPVEPVRVGRYEVRTGQDLAEIASLPEVYGDGLLWPLIYRANRDQIKTPTEIAPGQVLDIPRDKNSEELEAARREALELNLF